MVKRKMLLAKSKDVPCGALAGGTPALPAYANETPAPAEYMHKGWHSRGYLPHFDGGDITQAITFRLGDSLPQTVLEAWREELSRENAANMDAALRRRIGSYLDQGYGSSWLKEARVASMVQKGLLHFEGSRYKLSAWVVMPNHLHLILTPNAEYQLSGILHSLKSYTAHEANRILGREGQFWQDDYFDR